MASVSLAQISSCFNILGQESSQFTWVTIMNELVPFGLVEQVVLTEIVSLGLETCSNSLTYQHGHSLAS